MSEAIELEQWWADIADELGGQAAYLHVHGMDWRGRTDGNEVVARAVATIARLREELAEARGAQIEGWPGASVLNRWLREYRDERDSALADLAALRGRVEEAVKLVKHNRAKWFDATDFDRSSALLAILAPPEGP